MCSILSALLRFLMTLLRSRLALQLEIVALRHQIAVYQRSVSRPRLRATDRLFWVWLSRLWSGWQHALPQPGNYPYRSQIFTRPNHHRP
jgi:putative transposase